MKSFQVTGLTSTDPALVRNDETLQRVLATLSDGEQPLEDPEEEEDPFADHSDGQPLQLVEEN